MMSVVITTQEMLMRKPGTCQPSGIQEPFPSDARSHTTPTLSGRKQGDRRPAVEFRVPPGSWLIPVSTRGVEVADKADRLAPTAQASVALSAGSLSSRAIPHRPPSSQAASIHVPEPRASSRVKATVDAVTPATAARRGLLPASH